MERNDIRRKVDRGLVRLESRLEPKKFFEDLAKVLLEDLMDQRFDTMVEMPDQDFELVPDEELEQVLDPKLDDLTEKELVYLDEELMRLEQLTDRELLDYVGALLDVEQLPLEELNHCQQDQEHDFSRLLVQERLERLNKQFVIFNPMEEVLKNLPDIRPKLAGLEQEQLYVQLKQLDVNQLKQLDDELERFERWSIEVDNWEDQLQDIKNRWGGRIRNFWRNLFRWSDK